MRNENLMHAVLAEPEDDTPRLVYADWLAVYRPVLGNFRLSWYNKHYHQRTKTM